MEIKTIDAKDTLTLRHDILRPNQSLDDCHYPNDEENDTFHLGVFKDGQLISIGSFYAEHHPDIPDGKSFRLRGMATLPEYRGKGAGTKIISKAMEILGEKNADILWCNARMSAQGYYDHLGFMQAGDVFDLPPIGPHVVSYKKIEKL
ncbi:GNAT family N-acetyltransferase [Halobacillus litoralis]|uniref:GNAT family N-acetyltransferase n=1 Tax=Halobacillus litoralis TaxID=45668 RepID=UPI001CD274C0|nr:GNAT family N-acetyltransferase [Halobacillus litoralis]MCA0972743.1 GNAT family N-acetyltransferase [Halobacillus litoralis]